MKKSAGILPYRFRNGQIEFFLIHYGGPFWINKDKGSWSIPKGEIEEGENVMEAALREFTEETGFELRNVMLSELKPVKQKSGKLIYAWAAEIYIDPEKMKSNFFEMEWPPKSGKKKEFPEIDRGEWFERQEALLRINPAQISFIEQLVKKAGDTSGSSF